ncbi:LuxR C-terminal-related transcriptional regulator [Lysinibacillus sp. BW-2-10]|uniref:LuxR C-terminal-related transcriptional regulator n=1 Tax=Lysinibacillus sp. BW-2-10 TaxID=2590030 RepID=UPI0011812F8A|nr:LuxR C-terminal-related transcriptional regulator [Lysinibacillus sp. BW-2-10]TSI03938.1 response regulator transcription factor [Lysinibacillus sp. BW-2-10]
MNRYGLTSVEYEKIIHFSAQIAYPVEDTRLHIQHKLEDFFGFDQTIFWYADDYGNLTDPINYKLSDKALTDYLDEYHFYDLLHPTKNVNLFYEKKAIRLEELVALNQNDKSPFNHFLKEYGYHDEMVVALIHQGTFVGAIGMAQKNDSYKFTSKDSNTLQLLSDVIASVLLHQVKDKQEFNLLSDREMDVVHLLKKGWTNQAIASTLHISVNTVKKHLQNIYEKYSVQNRTQLVQKL